MIAVGLIHETTAIGQNADDSRLSAVDDVWVETDAFIAIAHDRNGAPCHGGCDAAIEMSAHRFAEPHAIAGDRARRQCPLLAAGRQAGTKLPSSHNIVRETTRCEQNASSSTYRRNAIGSLYDRAQHRSVLEQQAHCRRRYPNFYTEIVG